METVLDRNDAADWSYRGEGAVNLVLAYSGSSPLFFGKIIRIQKAPRNGRESGSNFMYLCADERRLWRDVMDLDSCTDRDVACQVYVKHVMIPLLDSKHVDAGVHVYVTREFLETIEKNILGQRPGWRAHAGQINIHRDSVLLQSDHSIFPQGGEGDFCISVEIKPKWGCLPTSRFITKRNSIKKSVSRFRMHQALKLQKGEISTLSDYNPLDLFSRSQDRIYNAIKDLFSTPQNNFRVFLNGSLILGASGGYADDTNLVIEEAFEGALQSVIQTQNGSRTMSFLQLVAEAVYKSGCLNRLLEVQKLDSFDIEGAIHAYYDIISEPCQVCRHMDDEELLNKCHTLHSSLDQSSEIVRNFLIAATAKDCSLMITFRPWHVDCPGSTYHSIFVESTNQTFDYKVNFIDLDLKPFKKMEEYYEQDKKIVRSYTKMFVTGVNTNCEIYGFDIDGKGLEGTNSRQGSLKLDPNWVHPKIINPCNGLLLCTFLPKSQESDYIAIVNPMTNEYTTIPSDRGYDRSSRYGFGFSPNTKQYKVVRIIEGGRAGGSMVVEISTLDGSNNWRRINTGSYRITVTNGVYLNGSVYWFGRNKNMNLFICRLDVEEETFQGYVFPNVVVWNKSRML